MKVSQKVEYAMRAMLELAFHFGAGRVVCTADIARNQRIPGKFLELILVELRRAGLVMSQRGAEGGHRLARAPEFLSVGDIWRAIDGPLAEPAAQAAEKGKGVSDPFRSVWGDVAKAVSRVVDSTSLADVMKRAEAKRSTPDYSI